jgi:tetratricopeptide (TPR) repeat protein
LKGLSHSDGLHLRAAEGWLELGNWLEANEELERITPTMRVHPAVLQLRWEIYAKAGKWEMAVEIGRALSEMLPENSWGFIHYAFALHELKRTKEAWGVLIPVVDKFTDEFRISYNLACYCCQLEELKDALKWIEKAFAVAGKEDIRLMALEDPDLELLWKQIGQI